MDAFRTRAYDDAIQDMKDSLQKILMYSALATVLLAVGEMMYATWFLDSVASMEFLRVIFTTLGAAMALLVTAVILAI